MNMNENERSLLAENEGLTAENHARFHEIERLRKTLREWQEGYPGQLIAEVESLREELRDRRDFEIPRLEAEVATLREEVLYLKHLLMQDTMPEEVTERLARLRRIEEAARDILTPTEDLFDETPNEWTELRDALADQPTEEES